ncbi:MAG: hypothetical protein JEZ08_00560 [Clostridiales bacterium]|nr:hypothetical protein [Clostridiales bacterium]
MKNSHIRIYSVLIITIVILLLVIVSEELELNDQSELSQQLENNMNNTIVELKEDIDALQSEKQLLDELLEISDEDNRLHEAVVKRLVNELDIAHETIEKLTIVDYTTIHKLETQGILDYKTIEMDLANKPEMIGFDGVLGGTMFFWSIHLLNDQWVYAEFEDGHIDGAGIYEFSIEDDGTIYWKSIDEKLYE